MLGRNGRVAPARVGRWAHSCTLEKAETEPKQVSRRGPFIASHSFCARELRLPWLRVSSGHQRAPAPASASFRCSLLRCLHHQADRVNQVLRPCTSIARQAGPETPSSAARLS